jgi:hypothetical protein
MASTSAEAPLIPRIPATLISMVPEGHSLSNFDLDIHALVLPFFAFSMLWVLHRHPIPPRSLLPCDVSSSAVLQC